MASPPAVGVSRLPGCRPWLFTKHVATIYTEATFSSGDVLVFGSESRGLPPGLLEANANAQIDTIHFDIPTSDPNHAAGTWTIRPTAGSALPGIDQPVTIEEGRGIIRATGLILDNASKTLKLNSEVRGTMQPGNLAK